MDNKKSSMGVEPKAGRPRETFGPSVIERPLLRVRFLDPDGEEQQSTLSSSWHADQRPEVGGCTRDPEEVAPCAFLDAIHGIVKRNNCTLLGVELVQTRVVAQIC